MVRCVIGLDKLIREMHENKGVSEENIRDAVDIALMDKEKATATMLERLINEVFKSLGTEETDDVEEENSSDEEEECPDFRIVIDREHTEWKGSPYAILTGLAAFIEHLCENFPKEAIQAAIKSGLGEMEVDDE